DYYSMSALGYLNHPPYWVHPADQHSPNGVTLLIKNSGPVDFEYVPIPQKWNGKEFCAVERGIPADDSTGISSLPVVSVPWAWQGTFQVRTLYEFRDGMRTELPRLPPGWRADSESDLQREMLFVLDGNLRVGDKELAEWGYCSGRGSQLAQASTEVGATVIRWRR